MPSPTSESLQSVRLRTPQDGWAVGHYGTILHWDGSAWTQVASPVRNNLNEIVLVPDPSGTGWLSGDGWIVGDTGQFLRFGPYPDFALRSSASPQVVPLGSVLTYTLVATNHGAAPATHVLVTDTLPAGLTLLAATPGCVAIGNDVTCELTPLLPGAGSVLTISVTVEGAAGWISDHARITADEPDAVPGDTEAQATVCAGGACSTVLLPLGAR